MKSYKYEKRSSASSSTLNDVSWLYYQVEVFDHQRTLRLA